MSGLGEGVPGDMEPGRARQQLVGMWAVFEEFHEAQELRRVFRADIGSLTDEVLGVLDATDLAVHGLTTETRIDDDGANDESCRFQQLMAAIGQIGHGLHRGDVLGVFPQMEEFAQLEMRR